VEVAKVEEGAGVIRPLAGAVLFAWSVRRQYGVVAKDGTDVHHASSVLRAQ